METVRCLACSVSRETRPDAATTSPSSSWVPNRSVRITLQVVDGEVMIASTLDTGLLASARSCRQVPLWADRHTTPMVRAQCCGSQGPFAMFHVKH